ncbi:hypothetical protein [Lichenicoccus sp.]|uniref:hypothetical protein n=1 Tax=Lichenicoccus sp. TaxID=2781899 RepID=UPI003D0F45DA
MRRHATSLAALLALAACHGQPPSPPTDQALQQAAHSGREALNFDHPNQAVTQYRHAFSLALARDDAGAIADLGYDLAVAQLAAGDAAPALATVLRTRAALRARNAPAFAGLDLVQAAALHHLGADRQADTLAALAQSDPATRVQASRLRGRIAAAHDDQAGLSAAIAALGTPKHPIPDWQSGHDELSARLDLLRGNYARAAASAESAAAIQRTQLDYRDMAGSLALAALATQRGGNASAAADLYLQAGESAAARGDTTTARPWLEQAEGPGATPATAQAARTTLQQK